ncbi:hypothetical protein [Ethanoligenens sp.]|uniref:hypothetical protein n=1 Tax=Ethanoligenens sp. TaxID=2099655 RepID=UPI0039E830C3
MENPLITLNAEGLELLQSAMAAALIQTAESILARERSDAVIPMDTGRLQNIQTYVDSTGASQGIVAIVTDAPQAARLYFHPDFHFRQDKNTNARGEWWEPWISGSHRTEPTSLFTALLKQHAKEILL